MFCGVIAWMFEWHAHLDDQLPGRADWIESVWQQAKMSRTAYSSELHVIQLTAARLCLHICPKCSGLIWLLNRTAHREMHRGQTANSGSCAKSAKRSEQYTGEPRDRQCGRPVMWQCVLKRTSQFRVQRRVVII